ncbi:uncharacterized protein LOC130672205 [Microplitis mediator]|uniref:uncharacterized protein LOC130672205 n=1 Tax=Microplitis mediator TaxID=375433 RepID=UPI002554C57F|nr:uncharacterized protein LOC130672205 [Microplitis mediator]XP_057332601.1 uncharacterized protein LOC130672205 [Microplitis mediator]
MVKTRKYTKELQAEMRSMVNQSMAEIKKEVKETIQQHLNTTVQLDNQNQIPNRTDNFDQIEQMSESQEVNKQKKIPVIREDRRLTKPLLFKKHGEWMSADQYNFNKSPEDDEEVDSEEVIIHAVPGTAQQNLNVTTLTHEERVWSLDKIKRNIFMSNIKQVEELQVHNAIWCKTMADMINWTKQKVKTEKNLTARIEIIESMPKITSRKHVEQLERELGIKKGDVGYWENSIINYIVKDVQLWDNTEDLEGIQNSTQIYQKTQQEMGSREKGNVPMNNYNKYSVQYTQPQMYAHNGPNVQYTHIPDQRTQYQGHQGFNTMNTTYNTREDNMKKRADKIKSMEILIRSNNLKYTADSQPKQWLQAFTETCIEQEMEFEERIDLLKIAIASEKEWFKQNVNTWTNWEDVKKSFNVAFCKTTLDTEVLQEIFSIYQRKNENTQEFVRHMRSKFAELEDPMTTAKQLEIIKPKLTIEIQRELNSMQKATTYKQFAELISIAESRVADIRRVKEARKIPVRRLQTTRDSVNESTESSSEEEETTICRVKRKSRRTAVNKIKSINHNKDDDKKINVIFNRKNQHNDRERSRSRDRSNRSGSNTSRGTSKSVGGTYTCLNCGMKGGHKTRDCEEDRVDVCVRCFTVGATAKQCSCRKN